MTDEAAPRLGAGDVQIELRRLNGEDPEPLVLRPSYNAARVLSNQAGGLMKVMQRCVDLDLNTIVDVIALGLGYGQTRRPPPELPERIFATGVSDNSGGLASACVTYIGVLMAGGQVPPETGPGPTPGP